MTKTVKSMWAVAQEPLLLPNKILGLDPELPWTDLPYPCLCSDKLNGVRALALGGKLLSRNMTELNLSADVWELLRPIAELAHAHKLVLDGELHAYSHNTVGETMSILAGKKHTPTDFYYKVFYSLPWDCWNGFDSLPASEWSFQKGKVLPFSDPRLLLVQQRPCTTHKDVLAELSRIEYSQKEGLVFLNPDARYKHGRCTLSERIAYKYKKYSDPIDAVVCSITARRERLPSVEAERHAHSGKAKAVHTQDSFQMTECAGVLVCKMECGTIVEVPFPVGTTIPDREVYYQEFGKGGPADLKGRWLCFRALSCENRGLPIAIKDVQFRDSK